MWRSLPPLDPFTETKDPQSDGKISEHNGVLVKSVINREDDVEGFLDMGYPAASRSIGRFSFPPPSTNSEASEKSRGSKHAYVEAYDHVRLCMRPHLGVPNRWIIIGRHEGGVTTGTLC